jgi:hypothetical protein
VAAALCFLLWAVRRRTPSIPANGLDLSPQSSGPRSDVDLDPYLSQVDATVDRLRDEPVR